MRSKADKPPVALLVQRGPLRRAGEPLRLPRPLADQEPPAGLAHLDRACRVVSGPVLAAVLGHRPVCPACPHCPPDACDNRPLEHDDADRRLHCLCPLDLRNDPPPAGWRLQDCSGHDLRRDLGSVHLALSAPFAFKDALLPRIAALGDGWDLEAKDAALQHFNYDACYTRGDCREEHVNCP